jgi:3-phosphoshikimate 1-carboxyvinyltransferase
MMRVKPVRKVQAELTVPADKSISHRAGLLSALAAGTTHIINYSPGQDCASTLRCISVLGANVDRQGNDLFVTGAGIDGLREAADVLDCGNSGTTMRLLSGILAGQPFHSVLTGDASLRSRPMRRVLDPLRQMGASVDGRGGGQLAPISIRGGGLRALDAFQMPVASAQVKSCILLASLFTDGTTTVIEQERSRDHTERMLPLFGARVTVHGKNISMPGHQELRACQLEIPGDVSSAAFWIAAGAMLADSSVKVRHVGLNPLRAGFIEVLKRAGCRIDCSPTGGDWEEISDVSVEGSAIGPFDVHPEEVPTLIDEVPMLAVCAAMAEGTSVFYGASELRHKECDRISAVVENLRAMGVEADELPDGFAVHGRGRLRGANIKTHGDHRIAMAFAIAGLVATGETILDDIGCIDISYPGFTGILHQLSERGEATSPHDS